MRLILHRGTTFGWAFALLMCAAAWLASAASASDAIYWTSYTNSGGVRVGDLGGSGARDLFTGESSPEGVAIDAAAGTIYWADTTSGAIRVANLDGTGARDLYTGESQPSGVAIDPTAGLIYWADAVSGSGAIRVGNLDGSGARTLFAGESYPVGVTIDPAAGKIYWGSYDTFKIRVGNLDGTGARDLFTGENYPTQLAIDPAAGKLYWTNEFARQRPGGEPRRHGSHELVHGRGRCRGRCYRSDGREDLLEQLESRHGPGREPRWLGAGAEPLHRRDRSVVRRAPAGPARDWFPTGLGERRGRQFAVVQPGELGVRSARRFPVSRPAERHLPVDCRGRAGRRRDHELSASRARLAITAAR